MTLGDTIQSIAGGHHKPGSWSHLPFRIPTPDGEGKEKQGWGRGLPDFRPGAQDTAEQFHLHSLRAREHLDLSLGCL